MSRADEAIFRESTMTFGEHLRELNDRARQVAVPLLLCCSGLYLLQPERVNELLWIDTATPIAGLSRFAAVVFLSIVLVWPIFVFHAWQFVAAGLYHHERRLGLVVAAGFSTLLFGGWLLGGRFLWPWLRAVPTGEGTFWALLGIDPVALLLKANMLPIALVVVVLALAAAAAVAVNVPDPFDLGLAQRLATLRKTLRKGRGVLAVFILLMIVMFIPNYVWAAFVLFTLFDCICLTAHRALSLLLVMLPVAMGVHDVRGGAFPWDALVLTGVFLGHLWGVRSLAKGLRKVVWEGAVRYGPLLEGAGWGGQGLVSVRPEEDPFALPPTRRPVRQVRIPPDPATSGEMIDHLKDALVAGDEAVRLEAAWSLSEVGGSAHLDALARAARDRSSQPVQLAAIEGLVLLGGDKARQILVSLRDSDEPLAVRWRASEMVACLDAGKKPVINRSTVHVREDSLVRFL